MKLKDYLEQHKITQVDFAKVLNIGHHHLNRIVNDRKIPHRKLAMRISEQTKGEVTAEELLLLDKHKGE